MADDRVPERSTEDRAREAISWRVRHSIDRDEIVLFVSLVLLFLTFRAEQLVPDFYWIDDYLLFRPAATVAMPLQFLRDGRLVTYFVYEALMHLGVHPEASSAILSLAAFLLLATSAVLIARLWALPPASLASVLVCGCLFLHPYASEIWTFRGAIFILALAVLVATTALWWLERGGGVLVAAVLMSVALGIYQTVFSYVLVLILFVALLDLARSVRDGSGSPWEVARRRGPAVSAVVIGAVGYLTITGIVQRILGIAPTGRGILLRPDHAAARLEDVAKAMRRIFWREPHLSTRFLQVVLLALLGVLCLLWLRRLRETRGMRETIGGFAVFASLLAAAALAILATILPLDDWWPAPRNLSAAGIFWGGVIAAAYTMATGRSRTFVLGTAGLVLVGFLSVDARVAADQRRVNRRDHLLANRIVARLEQHSEYRGLRRLVVMNHPYKWRDIDTTTHNLNISALAVPWAQANVIVEITGIQLEKALPEDFTRGASFCAQADKWPGQGSVTIVDGLGIVCF